MRDVRWDIVTLSEVEERLWLELQISGIGLSMC